jgi:asparagine synthase (glutamine-hydrolysing)
VNIVSGALQLNRHLDFAAFFEPSLLFKQSWQPDHQQRFSDPQYAINCTQRYIQPQDHHAPMPYHHQASGIVVAGDLFLMERDKLLSKLNVSNQLADIELVAEAYLKWGTDCVHHLSGHYLIAVWDSKNQRFFLANDRHGTRPCFYAYLPNHTLYFANILKPVAKGCGTLTLNDQMFKHFALDSVPGEQTCYKEILKLPAAHCLTISEKGIKLARYWQLKDERCKLPYKKHEDYYEAFQEIFSQSTKDCLRSDHAICTHISGGLDSSSVASMAASLLTPESKTLHAITALPNILSGDSFRPGWKYHEMPMVQSILNQYPSIQHHQYYSSPETDMLAQHALLYDLMDQPIRNVLNFDWIIGSFHHATHHQCRTILTGQNGNASISWKGESMRNRLSRLRQHVKLYFKPHRAFGHYYDKLNYNFLQRTSTRQILRNRCLFLDLHYLMLTSPGSWARRSTTHPMELYYGIQQLDPTASYTIQSFCYNVPQWVYMTGKTTAEQRLLVREGLSGIVPEAVRKNTFRGEQAADWYLQYNYNIPQWRAQLENLHPDAADIIWSLYDKAGIFALLDRYPHIKLADINKQVTLQVRCMLMRCLSASFFLNHLLSSPTLSVSVR